jgi:hypothetical protein
MTTITLNFNPPGQHPDADTSVLVSIDVEGLEVWDGHWDGQHWIDDTRGAPFSWPVTAWADKPQGVDLRAPATTEDQP